MAGNLRKRCTKAERLITLRRNMKIKKGKLLDYVCDLYGSAFLDISWYDGCFWSL